MPFSRQFLIGFDPKRSIAPDLKDSGLEGFAQRIEEECVQGSAIAHDLYAAAIKVVADTEQQPGGESSYPIHEALDWHLTRYAHQARQNLYAALFVNEDGTVWQAKLSECIEAGKKAYRAPVGNGSRAFLPTIPPEIRQAISDRYGVIVPSIGSFWDWLEAHPEVPIIYTEGGKKALALLSLGYVAIALYGVNSGYRSKDEWGNKTTPCLISDVARFAGAGRQSILAFDEDEKPETKRRVNIALSRFGGLLSAGGEVKIVQWDGTHGKGVDDLIANAGVATWEAAHDQALPLNHWQIWQRLNDRLTHKASLRLTMADLSKLELENRPQEGVIAVASPKATGKTNFIRALVSAEDKVLAAGHRVTLMRNICERLGLGYRGDLDKVNGQFIDGSSYTLRVGFCVDSLMAIDPETFRGCVLAIDEVVQVVRHLLTSETCSKSGMRPLLLARFKALIRAARLVIIADADLNDAVIRYIHELRGDETPVFLIRNDHQLQGYPTQFVQSPDRSPVVGQLLADVKKLELRKVLFLAADSLRTAKSLARLIAHQSPEKRILAINSETSGGEVQREFMLTPDVVLARAEYDVIICTPSLATGVSIEAQGIIARVYGIFTGGSSTDADMAQALGRVREPVERVVWCAKRGSNFSKVSRSTNSLELKSHLEQRTSAVVSLVRSQLKEDTTEVISAYDWQSDAHVNLFCQLAAEQNRSMWNLRDALLVRLKFEGNYVTIDNRTSDSTARVLLKEAREELKQIDAKALVSARVVTHVEVMELESKEGIGPEDQKAIARYYLVEFYCLNPNALTLEDVLADKEGRRRAELLNLEAQLQPGLAVDRTARALEKQASWNQGLCPWDVSGGELRRLLREQLGLNDFLNLSRKSWTKYDLKPYADRIRKNSQRVKLILNFTVKPEIADTQLVHQLLSQLGIKLTSRWSRSELSHEGEKIRVYSLDLPHWETTIDVLNRRKERRERYQKEHIGSGSPASSITESGKGDPRQKRPLALEKWMAPESLREIRSQWDAANTPEEREALKQVIPCEVLTRAIA